MAYQNSQHLQGHAVHDTKTFSDNIFTNNKKYIITVIDLMLLKTNLQWA